MSITYTPNILNLFNLYNIKNELLVWKEPDYLFI